MHSGDEYKVQVGGVRTSVSLPAECWPYALFPQLSFLPQLPWLSSAGDNPTHSRVVLPFRGKPAAAGSPHSVSDTPFIHTQVSKGRSEAGVLTRENCETARWGGGGPVPGLWAREGLCCLAQAERRVKSPRPTLQIKFQPE